MKKEHKELMKARRRNIGLVVAYDGGNYHGFQRQTPPVTAVQNVLERKLSVIFGDEIEMAAAGRTDAGVHAYGQVVNFFTDGTIPVERIVRAANSILPDDIVVKEAFEADEDFSARHSVKSKIYVYRILQGDTPDPFWRNYAWYIRRPLAIEKMQEAMQFLLGEHDFSSFQAAGGTSPSPVRTLYEAACEKKSGGIIEFRFWGNGFLYHMVRNIVGTIADVGLGKISPQEFQQIILAKNRRRASATAPAQGLFFAKVLY